MKLRASTLSGLAAAVVLAFGTAAAEQADKPSYSNKWRIEVSESAKSDGTMLFRMTPKE